MKIELNEAQTDAIKATLMYMSWIRDREERGIIIGNSEYEWRFRACNPKNITLNSGQLKELATLFQEEE